MSQPLDAVLDFVKDNFKSAFENAIAAINSANTDFALNFPDSAAWQRGSLNDGVMNYNEFLVYYVSNISSIQQGPSVARVITIEIDFAFPAVNDGNDYSRFLRYWDAFATASGKIWSTNFRGYDYPVIELLQPVDILLYNDSQIHKCMGVQISLTVG